MSLCPLPNVGGDIFALEKLLFPINIPKTHFFTICVFMRERTIRVFDSMPDSSGRSAYKDNILKYLKDEHLSKRRSPLPDQDSWIGGVNARTHETQTPLQSVYSNDCGVYTCLFMDFLLLNLPLTVLTQERIKHYGREWLCECILNESIEF